MHEQISKRDAAKRATGKGKLAHRVVVEIEPSEGSHFVGELLRLKRIREVLWRQRVDHRLVHCDSDHSRRHRQTRETSISDINVDR